MGRIKKLTELFLVSLLIFLGIFLSKYPTLHNYLNTPAGKFFPGNTSWFDAWGINTYVSYIRYGNKNGIMLENTYTTVPHQKAFVFQVYTFLGILNRYLKLNHFFLFHLASLAAGIILMLVIYISSRVFFISAFDRITALAVIVLGGGFGWLPGMTKSADYRLAGFNLIDPLERPHNAMTTMFLVAEITLLSKYIKTGKSYFLLLSVFAAFFKFMIHPPLALLSLLIYAGSYVCFRLKINLKKYLIYVLALFAAYSIYYLLFLNPFLSN